MQDGRERISNRCLKPLGHPSSGKPLYARRRPAFQELGFRACAGRILPVFGRGFETWRCVLATDFSCATRHIPARFPT
jgi:hypothetical protein